MGVGVLECLRVDWTDRGACGLVWWPTADQALLRLSRMQREHGSLGVWWMIGFAMPG